MIGLGQVNTIVKNILTQREQFSVVRTPPLQNLLRSRGSLDAALDFQDMDTIFAHDQKSVYEYMIVGIENKLKEVEVLAAGNRDAASVRTLLRLLGWLAMAAEITQCGNSSKIMLKVNAVLVELNQINIQSVAELQDQEIKDRLAELDKQKAAALKKAEDDGLNSLIKG
jgi:hypothetical protein